MKLYTVSKNGQVCVWDCSIDLDALVPDTGDAKTKAVADCEGEDDIVSKENGICILLLNFFTVKDFCF